MYRLEKQFRQNSTYNKDIRRKSPFYEVVDTAHFLAVYGDKVGILFLCGLDGQRIADLISSPDLASEWKDDSRRADWWQSGGDGRQDVAADTQQHSYMARLATSFSKQAR